MRGLCLHKITTTILTPLFFQVQQVRGMMGCLPNDDMGAYCNAMYPKVVGLVKSMD